MRKVVVQQFVTLDGYAAGPNGELDFVTETGAAADPTSGPFVEEQLAFIESLDTILLGAVTYRMFAAYWPEQTTETQAIADALNEIPKVVFSRTLESADWPETRIASGDLSEEISRLREEPGKDILVHGGSNLVTQLGRAGLIDEYRVIVHPVAVGEGDPLFGGRTDLNLIDSRIFGTGAVALILEPSDTSRFR